MIVNARRDFVCEGLKQAGWVCGALLLLGGVGWIGLQATTVHNYGVRFLIGLTTVCAASVLAGPAPTFLIVFDITDRQLFVLSCFFIIPYWACLGTVAGVLQWRNRFLKTDPEPCFIAKKLSKRIRWSIEIVALKSWLLPWLPSSSYPTQLRDNSTFPMVVPVSLGLQIL